MMPDCRRQVEEYYYDHLPEELHEAYREIYVHLMKNEDEGSFLSEVSVDDFWRAYYAVLADHPEIFWIGTSAQVEESGLSHTVVIVFAGDDGSAEGPCFFEGGAGGGCRCVHRSDLI